MSVVFEHIHADARRTIYGNSTLLQGREMSIIKLNKGKAIGGCWHTNDEHFVVWSGKVEVLIKRNDKMSSDIYVAGQSGTFPKGSAHAIVAIDGEAIVSEWGITPEEKQCDQKDQELRDMVNEINDRQ